jgi:hypothetical protein
VIEYNSKGIMVDSNILCVVVCQSV